MRLNGLHNQVHYICQIRQNGYLCDFLKDDTDYYKKYIGCPVKRFHSKNVESSFSIIKGIDLDGQYGRFDYGGGDLRDIEDSMIITNELPIVYDERIMNVNHPGYRGWDPINKRTVLWKKE